MLLCKALLDVAYLRCRQLSEIFCRCQHRPRDLHGRRLYADDVALLAEMLSILVVGLGAMSEEASQLGLQVNWAETRIQRVKDRDPVPQVIHVGSSQVEVAGEFIYLGACTTHDGSSESEILRRPIGIARNCITLLEKHGSHISGSRQRLCVVRRLCSPDADVWF